MKDICNPIQDGSFLGCARMGEGDKSPEPPPPPVSKICHLQFLRAVRTEVFYKTYFFIIINIIIIIIIIIINIINLFHIDKKVVIF